MRSESKKKPPVYNVFAVTQGDSPDWNQIGVAWAHRDGKGLNLEFYDWPAGPTRIVLRATGQNQ